MKKTVIYAALLAFSMSLCAVPAAMANDGPPAAKELPSATETTKKEEIPPEIKVMINRIHEIKDMDKSSLTHADKKALRKEVRAIRAAIRSSGNGIYLSVGALLVIIIIILLV